MEGKTNWMMKRIVILNGSPRRGGNSDCLVEALCEGMGCGKQAMEGNVEVLQVADMQIAPCRGCNACFGEEHRCVQQDDVGLLYDALARAEVLVIVSPVYFYGISAQLAAAIQRLHNPLRDGFKIRHAALLLAAASHKPHVCDAIRQQYRMLLDHFGIGDEGQVVAQGVGPAGAVGDTEYMQQARILGAKLAAL